MGTVLYSECIVIYYFLRHFWTESLAIHSIQVTLWMGIHENSQTPSKVAYLIVESSSQKQHKHTQNKKPISADQGTPSKTVTS